MGFLFLVGDGCHVQDDQSMDDVRLQECQRLGHFSSHTMSYHDDLVEILLF